MQIIEQAMKHGLPLPTTIENAPILGKGLELYLVAFGELIHSRMLGMGGAGRIWWGEIQKYCESHDLDSDQTFAMHHHIGRLDEVYLDWMNKKSKGK